MTRLVEERTIADEKEKNIKAKKPRVSKVLDFSSASSAQGTATKKRARYDGSPRRRSGGRREVRRGTSSTHGRRPRRPAGRGRWARRGARTPPLEAGAAGGGEQGLSGGAGAGRGEPMISGRPMISRRPARLGPNRPRGWGVKRPRADGPAGLPKSGGLPAEHPLPPRAGRLRARHHEPVAASGGPLTLTRPLRTRCSAPWQV